MEEEEDLSFENLTLVVNNYLNKNFSDIVITDLPTRFVSNLHQVFGKRKYMVITLFVPNDDTLKARVLNPTRSSEYRDWAQAIALNKSIMNRASLPQEIKLNSEESIHCARCFPTNNQSTPALVWLFGYAAGNKGTWADS